MYNEFVDFVRKAYKTEAFIPLHAPVFNGNEKSYLLECIDTTFVSSVGKFVDRFEDEMKNYTGAKHAVAIVNGTSALHISLLVAGVQQNDLVITQPFSFIATCNAISYLKAEPVFVDINKKTLGLSAEKLQEFISTQCEQKSGGCYHKNSGKRIAACVPMHTFGHPAEIDKIAEICAKHNIPLVEDAAESIGSTYKGQQTGTFGLMGIFSFNGNKTITCGGGGALVTNDEKLAKMAKHLTTQAKVLHRWEFVHDAIGYNYRMPNINAALACAQLEQLDGFLQNKRELADSYETFLENKKPAFFKEPEGARSNYWLNAVVCENLEERNRFLTETNARGVMTRPAWELMHRLPMFANSIRTDLSVSEEMADRVVNVPSSVRLNYK